MSDTPDARPGALARAGFPAPPAGQPAVVLAPPGVGKTALLVHAALDGLRAGQAVLHVAVADTVDHVRAHYEAVLAADPDGDSGVDLHRRMIHSDRQLTPERLGAQLDLLARAANFVPTLWVVDGVEGAVRAQLDGLVALAQARGAALWASACLEPGVDPRQVLPVGARGYVLRPEQDRLRVGVVDEGVERLAEVSIRADGGFGPSPAPARHRPQEVTLYTGGAAGAEAAFGALAERWGLTEVNFTFPGHVQARSRGAVQLSERELKAGDVSLAYVSRRLQRTYSTEGTLIRRVLQTLWQMVSRARQVLVVGQIQPDGTVVGGTGWSVELARMWNKDLWVYDQAQRGWYTWSGDRWVEGTCVIDALEIAGTGTRNLEPHALEALEALFERSFGRARIP